MKRFFDPAYYHSSLYTRTKRKLEFRSGSIFTKWKKTLLSKLLELLGYEEPVKRPLKISWGTIKQFPEYTRRRLIFNSEDFADVPAYLIILITGSFSTW